MLFSSFFQLMSLVLRMMVGVIWDSKWYRPWWRRRTTKIKLLFPFRASKLKDTFFITSVSFSFRILEPKKKMNVGWLPFSTIYGISQVNCHLIVHKSGFAVLHSSISSVTLVVCALKWTIKWLSEILLFCCLLSSRTFLFLFLLMSRMSWRLDLSLFHYVHSFLMKRLSFLSWNMFTSSHCFPFFLIYK